LTLEGYPPTLFVIPSNRHRSTNGWDTYSVRPREKVEKLTVKDVKYITWSIEESRRKDSSITNIRKRIEKLRERNIMTNDIAELDKHLELIESTFMTKGPEWMQTEVDRAFKDAEIDPKRVVLYTVCMRLQGELIELAKTKGYEEFLKVTQEFPETKLKPVEGVCHLCGNRTTVMTDPAFDTASLLKIYVIDKKGFSSGISDDNKAWLRAFAICSLCRNRFQNGWRFINQKLRSTSSVKGIVVHQIPRQNVPIPLRSLENWVLRLRAAYDAVAKFEGVMQFEKSMDDYLQVEAGDGPVWYSLTIVFSTTGSGSHFALKGVIQDVPITRLSVLRNKMRELERWAQSLLKGDQKDYEISLDAIAGIFPLEADRRRVPRDPKPLLELFDSILTGSPYPHYLLMRRGLLMARIHRYDSYEGYSISPPDKKRDANARDRALCRGMLKYNLISMLLREMGALQLEPYLRSAEAQPEEVQLPQEVRDWFVRAGYVSHQKALFLLGYLIAEIGRRAKPGTEPSERTGGCTTYS